MRLYDNAELQVCVWCNLCDDLIGVEACNSKNSSGGWRVCGEGLANICEKDERVWVRIRLLKEGLEDDQHEGVAMRDKEMSHEWFVASNSSVLTMIAHWLFEGVLVMSQTICRAR